MVLVGHEPQRPEERSGQMVDLVVRQASASGPGQLEEIAKDVVGDEVPLRGPVSSLEAVGLQALRDVSHHPVVVIRDDVAHRIPQEDAAPHAPVRE